MLEIIRTRIGDDSLPIKLFVEQHLLRGSVFTMPPIDGDVIFSVCYYTEGDHLEIGCLDGGSAIIAGISKERCGRGEQVYTMDKQRRLYTLENIGNFKIDNIHFIEQHHPPLPEEWEDKVFGSAFIDADHSYAATKADWLNVKDRVKSYIMIHDVQHNKYGSRKFFFEACEDPEWTGLFTIGKIGVLERAK